jgi:hypothetical protein
MVYTPTMLWVDTGDNTLRWSRPGVTTGQEDTWSRDVFRWNTPRQTVAAPALARHIDGVYMAWVGTDHHIYTSRLGDGPSGDQDHTTWTSPTFTGFTTYQRPALASYAGRLYLAWKDASEGTIHWARGGAVGWEVEAATPWHTDYGPALGSSFFGGLFMAWRGRSPDSQVHWTQFNSASQWFDGPDNRFGGWTADSPALAGGLGLMYMVWRGDRTSTFDDKRLWWSRYEGGWSPQQPLDGWSVTGPSLAADGQSISLVYTEQNPQDGHGQLYWSHITPPGGWAPHQSLDRKAYYTPAIT